MKGLVFALVMAAAVSAASLSPPSAGVEAGGGCTQVIGFSQTQQWYAGAPDFESVAGDDTWQLVWYSGGSVDLWTDPDYAGWSQPVVSPCVSASSAPDRIVFTVSGNSRTPMEWASAMQDAIDVTETKYPTATTIALQPVVGGPDHAVCAAPGGGNVRASENHPDIDAGIALIVGGNVVAGASPEVRTCADYVDDLGHLTNDALGPIGEEIATFYVGGPVGGRAGPPGVAGESDNLPALLGATGVAAALVAVALFILTAARGAP